MNQPRIRTVACPMNKTISLPFVNSMKEFLLLYDGKKIKHLVFLFQAGKLEDVVPYKVPGMCNYDVNSFRCQVHYGLFS